MSGPPTYRGTSVRYFYKITIATQKVGAKVQALHLPIRVLSLPTIIKPDEIPALCNETTDELSPTNPFLEKRKNLETKLELALHHLQNITARRRPNFYLISNKRGRVGRFCLFKQNFKLGEDIVGTLDFSCRTVRCVQVSVTLQCEEILLRATQSNPATANSNNPDGKSATADGCAAASGKIMNFTKHHEVCLGLLQTQMILPVPLHVTPTFVTNAGNCPSATKPNSRNCIKINFNFFLHPHPLQSMFDGVFISNSSPPAMSWKVATMACDHRTSRASGKHL